MGENETLKFYTINEDYIEYLSKSDSHVSWNKEQKRPYIGIVLKVENYLYFAPLYSYKVGYDKYKDNPSFIRVEDRKGKNVSIIRFAEMIPVPETAIQLLDFNSRGDKYRDLLQAESDFINDNRNMIYSKAKKIYRNVVHIKIPFFRSISCDFELLEQKSKEYVGSANKETKHIKDKIHMEELEILKGILNSYPYFVVFVDNEYIIRFMNKTAQDHYDKKGKKLIGKSIFDCHNEKSIEIIKKNYEEIKRTGKDIFIFVNSKNQRVYMQGVKNEKGEWIGFIERFELNLQI